MKNKNPKKGGAFKEYTINYEKIFLKNVGGRWMQYYTTLLEYLKMIYENELDEKAENKSDNYEEI